MWSAFSLLSVMPSPLPHSRSPPKAANCVSPCPVSVYLICILVLQMIFSHHSLYTFLFIIPLCVSSFSLDTFALFSSSLSFFPSLGCFPFSLYSLLLVPPSLVSSQSFPFYLCLSSTLAQLGSTYCSHSLILLSICLHLEHIVIRLFCWLVCSFPG